MAQYIVRRLLLMVPVLVGVSLLVFALARVLPGDVFVAQSVNSGLSPEAREQLREEAGLNRPLPVQYLEWAGNAVRLDFGESLYNKQSVNKSLKRAFPITLELALLASLIGIAIAIPLGVISAAWQGSPFDYLSRFFGVLGLSVPNFVIGTLTISYLALWFHWTPPGGKTSVFEEPWLNIQQFVFPSLILGASFSASIMRMTRSTVLGVLREDYIRTARAKGLYPRPILIGHVLRNALLPVLTLAGTQVGFLLGGSVIIENIFSLTGIGAITFDAINNRDYIVIQAVATLAAFVFAGLNLLIDLSYAWLDPRIRLA
jgi:peptide/nickel transport system permease protein